MYMWFVIIQESLVYIGIKSEIWCCQWQLRSEMTLVKSWNILIFWGVPLFAKYGLIKKFAQLFPDQCCYIINSILTQHLKILCLFLFSLWDKQDLIKIRLKVDVCISAISCRYWASYSSFQYIYFIKEKFIESIIEVVL